MRIPCSTLPLMQLTTTSTAKRIEVLSRALSVVIPLALELSAQIGGADQTLVIQLATKREDALSTESLRAHFTNPLKRPATRSTRM